MSLLSEMFQDVDDSDVEFHLDCVGGQCTVTIGDFEREFPISQLADSDAEQILCSLFNQAMFAPVVEAEDAVGEDESVEEEPLPEGAD